MHNSIAYIVCDGSMNIQHASIAPGSSSLSSFGAMSKDEAGGVAQSPASGSALGAGSAAQSPASDGIRKFR